MFEKFIAMRYLRLRKGSGFSCVVSWFSFIGIVLGVSTLIIVTSIMNGFRDELFGKIVGMKGNMLAISSSSRTIKNYRNVIEPIFSLQKKISNIIPLIEKQAILINKGDVTGIIIHGLSKDSLKSKKIISDNIKTGNVGNFKENSVFIGKRLSETLNLSNGDKITLMIPGGLSTPFGSLPKQEEFSVSGIFEVGMSDYDKNILLMPLNKAQEFFGLQNSVTQLEIFVEDPSETKIISKNIENTSKELMIIDWQHSDASIFHAVKVEKNVMSMILSIIILVAIFNIISGLIMLTNSKKKDIGILRTMGATRKSIIRIFFYIGASIGILGTLIGAGIGVFISVNIDKVKKFLESISGTELFSEEIYFLSQLPSKIDFSEIFIITVTSIFFCLIASIYPARKASKLDPTTCIQLN